MARSAGVSGLAVALASAGGVLLYSAITNRPTLEALRGILGAPNPGGDTTTGPAFGDVSSGLPAAQNVGSSVGGAAGGGITGGAASAGGGDLVAAARRAIGKPYRWATAGPDSFDCSGLVVWALRQTGQNPPRFTTATFGTWASRNGWRRVSRAQFGTGDVILRPGHMAIAVSNVRMVHAPGLGKPVQEAAIYGPQSSWWGWRR